MTDMNHLRHLEQVTNFDARHVHEREQTYRGSWKKRGGIGAFMMLARKWDRLEPMAQNAGYDLFQLIETELAQLGDDPRGAVSDGTLLAEIRDLRQYLLLVEAEVQARHYAKHGNPYLHGTPADPHPIPEAVLQATAEDGSKLGEAVGRTATPQETQDNRLGHWDSQHGKSLTDHPVVGCGPTVAHCGCCGTVLRDGIGCPVCDDEEPTRPADEIIFDPNGGNGPGWYFYNPSDGLRYGPHDHKEEAQVGLDLVNDGQQPPDNLLETNPPSIPTCGNCGHFVPQSQAFQGLVRKTKTHHPACGCGACCALSGWSVEDDERACQAERERDRR